MHYLYDIWVNWFEGEENGFNVCAYHEWRKQDQIEMVDQIPVLYITRRLFSQIENKLLPLPADLLAKTFKKTYIRKGYGRQALQYACIVTDRKGVLVFDTLGTNLPLRKSRLIPRQERQVYEIAEKINQETYDLVKDKNDSAINDSWKLREQDIVGLTRKERKLKQILLLCLNQLKQSDNKKEISYWLSEWKGTNILVHTKDMSIDDVWRKLYELAISGWSANHERFLSQIVRSYPILKHEWNKELQTEKNKENQK